MIYFPAENVSEGLRPCSATLYFFADNRLRHHNLCFNILFSSMRDVKDAVPYNRKGHFCVLYKCDTILYFCKRDAVGDVPYRCDSPTSDLLIPISTYLQKKGYQPLLPWLIPLKFYCASKTMNCAPTTNLYTLTAAHGKQDRICRICCFRLRQAVQRYCEEPKTKHLKNLWHG